MQGLNNTQLLHETSLASLNENDVTSPVVSVLNAPVTTPRKGKLPKIKRKPDSFRPGLVTMTQSPVVQAKPLELHFFIPAGDGLTTDDEIRAIHSIVQSLGGNNQIGSITSYGFSNQTWEITMTLADQVVADHDDYLSKVFRALDSVISNLPSLCRGFCIGKSSRWEYRIGNSVADSGGLS